MGRGEGFGVEGMMQAKILDSIELKSGSHKSRRNGVCVMELVAWVANEPHSDHPACSSPVITAFLIRLNDRLPHEDRQRLKVLIPVVIGTRANAATEEKRRWMLTDFAVRVALPAYLRACGFTAEVDVLVGLAKIVGRAAW